MTKTKKVMIGVVSMFVLIPLFWGVHYLYVIYNTEELDVYEKLQTSVCQTGFIERNESKVFDLSTNSGSIAIQNPVRLTLHIKNKNVPKIIEIPNDVIFLDLSYQNLEFVDGLENLPYLTKLDLGANELQDISFLGKLNNLKQLDLRDNWLWDVSVLSNLKTLERLNLNLNIMGDPAPLANLTELKCLGLYKNQYLYDISALNSLQELEYVDLGLAAINEDSLNNYRKNNKNVLIDDVLKPFVGKKTFDLKRKDIYVKLKRNKIDLLNQEESIKFYSILDQISENILSNLQKDVFLSSKDVEQIKIPLLKKIKSQQLAYTNLLGWETIINPVYISEKLRKYDLFEKVTYQTVYDNYKNLIANTDYVPDIVFLTMPQKYESDIPELFNRYVLEITADLKRQGVVFPLNELKIKDKQVYYGDEKYGDIVSLQIISNGQEKELFYYLHRYPEIGSVGLNGIFTIDDL